MKVIKLWIETIYSLVGKVESEDYFAVLDKFISNGFELHFYYHSKDGEPSAIIKDLRHLTNFRQNLHCFDKNDPRYYS